MNYYPVLDHGFVALVDSMGDDSAIERAARVSYGTGTRKVSETRGLLRYLMRHRHTTPFEMVEFTFHCAMPIFVARQWIRHRTANVNEYSGRYSEMPHTVYTPNPWRKQSDSNKQGSGDTVTYEDELYYSQQQKTALDSVFEAYAQRLDGGVAKELARIDLPLSTYTQWYWKMDLHNLVHFLTLRLDSHAQYEVRVFAEVIAGLIQPIVPLAWEAFRDYQLDGVHFTGADMEQLLAILNFEEGTHGGNDREVAEFREKLRWEKSSVDYKLLPEPITPEEAQTRFLGEVTTES